MSEQKTNFRPQPDQPTGFFQSLFMGLVGVVVKMLAAFAVGTGAAALACWYYGVPLVFSLLGGILVLALALALSMDSPFS